jgi:hypothetical protein
MIYLKYFEKEKFRLKLRHEILSSYLLLITNNNL